jgi:ornithine decarboxylase
MRLETECGEDRVIQGSDVLEVLQRVQPSEPVFCLDQTLLDRRAQAILTAFDGDISHDVTVNPHPYVLGMLAQAGVRRFAVSRVDDLVSLDRFADAVTPVLRQPINSRQSLRVAAERHGVRVFTVDHPDELAKLHEEVGAVGLEVEILVSLSMMRQAGDTASGPSNRLVEAMVRTAIDFGLHPSIAVHPGVSSTDDVVAALAYCRSLAQRCGVVLNAINLGSAEIRSDGETVEELCAAVSARARRFGLGPTRLRLDASRAMVDACCSVLAQVLLRKSQAIYLNDGRFGWLHSLDRRLRRNAIGPQLRRLNGTPSDWSRSFHIFGPTCDSYDAFETSVVLPADVREGDWIEIPAMGADTIAWVSSFNGLHPSLFAVVTPPTASNRRGQVPMSNAGHGPLTSGAQR